jgi:hypothetical protein
MSYRMVNGAHTYSVVEQGQSYQLRFAQKEGAREWEPIHLWKVDIIWKSTKADTGQGYQFPINRQSVAYVLAPNEAQAISQATAGHIEEEYAFAMVERLPFRVRGWSKNEF